MKLEFSCWNSDDLDRSIEIIEDLKAKLFEQEAVIIAVADICAKLDW